MKNKSDTKKIAFSMYKSKVNNSYNNQQNQTCCALCGKEIKEKSKGFHKSHTIPYFCLENIKSNYKSNQVLLTPQYMGMHLAFDDKDYIGTEKAGVFYSICSKCDQKVFSVYESEKALLTTRPEDLVNVLSLKIYLNELFISRFQQFKNSINHHEMTEDQMVSKFYKHMGRIKKPSVDLDVRDFYQDFLIAKNSCESEHKTYKIIYHTILDYTVPVAAQVSIPVSKNVDYSTLQDVTPNNKKRLQDLLICIFPLKEKSVIFVFYRIGDVLMKKYAKKFKKLSEQDKLREIVYLLIRYKNRNYFFSPKIREALDNRVIREIFSIEDTVIGTTGLKLNISNFEDLSLKGKMPLLLSRKFSLQSINV